MTLDDLSSYSVPIRNVSQIDYRSFKVTSTTAPSSGIVAMSVLKALNTYDNLFAPDNVNLSTHRMDEAIPFGYGDMQSAGRSRISTFSTYLHMTHPDRRLFFITGAAGGSRIVTTTIQNVIHVVVEGLPAVETLARPRLHDQLVPNQVLFEYGYDNSTVKYMKQRGHNVTWTGPRLPDWSETQAYRVLQNGTFEAAGEPRQSDDGGFAI